MKMSELIANIINLGTLICVVIGLWKGKAIAVSIDGRIDELLKSARARAEDQYAVGEKRGRDTEIERRNNERSI